MKEDNEKLAQECNDLEKENNKLKSDLKRMKGMQKIVDALRMNRREQTKNYQTESISLDYLRPRDFEDDNIRTGNAYVRAKIPSNSNAFRISTKKEDDKNDDKAKSAALALMRVRQAQEQKRKKDE